MDDDVLEKTATHLTIFDIRWFSTNSNLSDKTIKVYQAYVDTYLHEYLKPGKYFMVDDLAEDSRLFVFLGQQFETNREDLNARYREFSNRGPGY